MSHPATSLRSALPGILRFGRYIGDYLTNLRGLIAVSSMALLAQTLLRMLEPWPLKFVIDEVMDRESARMSFEILDRLEPMTLLMVAAIALVAIAGLRALTAYASTVGFALVGSRVLTQLRDSVFRHLQCLPLSFHNKSRSGDLVVRIIGDIGMVKEVAVTAVLPLLGNLLILLGMLLVMLWLHWQLALLVVAVLPLMWLTTLRQSRKIHQVARTNRKREGAMAATASESIGAIKTVQSLSLDNQFADEFARENNKSLKEGVKAKRLAAGLERSVDVLVAVATALTLWFGARLVVRQELTPGELLVFLFYVKQALRPARDFAKYTARVAKASAAAERVMDLLDQVPAPRSAASATSAPRFRGAVSFANTSFGYEPGQLVVKDINLNIQPGQRVALVGPSGSGKTTLASLLLRLYEPNNGRILIDGHDIREFELESLRSQISVVLQDTLLFAASVRDNIGYGSPGISEQTIIDAARLANAHGFIEALPNGFDTVLGERGVTLSNGQRQRIAIARAAVRQSPILILDEPTTGLDKDNEILVLQALERLAKGRTTLLITHRLESAARSDYVVYLQNGRIPESGTHDALIRRNGRYAALYRLQFGEVEPAETLPVDSYAIAN